MLSITAFSDTGPISKYFLWRYWIWFNRRKIETTNITEERITMENYNFSGTNKRDLRGWITWTRIFGLGEHQAKYQI